MEIEGFIGDIHQLNDAEDAARLTDPEARKALREAARAKVLEAFDAGVPSVDIEIVLTTDSKLWQNSHPQN